MNRYLVTGAAGFIGAHVSAALLDAGHEVVGLDNVNDYYDTTLKRHRLQPLLDQPHFSFTEGDLSDSATVEQLFRGDRFHSVIHLAAQAGVRYSLENPDAYIQSNIVGLPDRCLPSDTAGPLCLRLLQFGRRQQRPRLAL